MSSDCPVSKIEHAAEGGIGKNCAVSVQERKNPVVVVVAAVVAVVAVVGQKNEQRCCVSVIF